MEGAKAPDWLREAAVAVRDDAVRFLVTVVQSTRHPRRFAAAWFAGETRALNPIGHVSTALAVTAAVKAVTAAAIGMDDDSGLWSSLAVATLPYAYYALLGVLCHIVLRLTGPTRPLSASLAIALYVGGGPGLLLAIAIDVDVLLYFVVADHPQLQHAFEDAPSWAVPILFGLVMGMYALFVMALASTLSALHGAGLKRTLAAILVALAVSGLLLGALHAAFPFSLGVPHFLFLLHARSPVALQF